MTAAYYGRKSTVSLLLELGANKDAKNLKAGKEGIPRLFKTASLATAQINPYSPDTLIWTAWQKGYLNQDVDYPGTIAVLEANKPKLKC